MSKNDHQRKLDALLRCSTSRLEILEASEEIHQQIHLAMTPVYKAKASFESLPKAVRWLSLGIPLLGSAVIVKILFAHHHTHNSHFITNKALPLARSLLVELMLTTVVPAIKLTASNFVRKKMSGVFSPNTPPQS